MSAHPPYFANAEVLSLDPETVDCSGKRIGLFYPAKAAALGALIAEHGQNEPIKVVRNKAGRTRPWRLVAGLHRLEGIRQSGVASVYAIEVLGDEAYLDQVQASENMHRRELEPIERAMFVQAVADAARVRVLAEHGVSNHQALGAKARQNKVQYSDEQKADELARLACDNLSRAYGWNAEVSEALGMGKRDIQRSMRIYRCIVEPFPEHLDALKDHPVAKAADSLLKIAALGDVKLRRRVIEALVAGEQSLLDAMVKAGVAKEEQPRSAYDKFSGQMLDAWARLGTADKRRVIPALVRNIPEGMQDEFIAEIERQRAENAADGTQPQ